MPFPSLASSSRMSFSDGFECDLPPAMLLNSGSFRLDISWREKPDAFEEAQVTGNLVACYEAAHRTWQTMRHRANQGDVDTSTNSTLYGPNDSQKRTIRSLLARGLLPKESFLQYVTEPPKPKRVEELASMSPTPSLASSSSLRDRLRVVLDSPRKSIMGKNLASTQSLPSQASWSSETQATTPALLDRAKNSIPPNTPPSRPRKPRRMTVNDAETAVAQMRYWEFASSLVWHKDTFVHRKTVSLNTPPASKPPTHLRRATVDSSPPIVFSPRETRSFVHVPKPPVLSEPNFSFVPSISEEEEPALRWYHIALVLLALWSAAVFIVVLLLLYILISAPLSAFISMSDDEY